MSRWMRALLAAGVLVGVLVGLPVLLVALAGWPLPSKPPDWGHISVMFRQGDIPGNAVIKSLAAVLWLVWAAAVWSFTWELITSLHSVSRGRRPPRRSAPVVPAAMSLGIGRLVAAILAIGIASGPTAALSAGPRLPVATLIAEPAAMTATALSPTRAMPRPTPARHRFLTATGDTVWDVAEMTLGDGSRVDEIVTLNPGVRPARLLQPGLVLQLPGDATVPADRRPAETASAAPDGDTVTEVLPASTRTAQAGDTLWKISDGRLEAAGVDRNGTTIAGYVHDIAAATKIDDPNLIYVGEDLQLPPVFVTIPLRPPATPTVQPAPNGGQPVDTTAAASPVVVDHVVVKGETLWHIIKAHYRTVDAHLVSFVADYNGLDDPAKLAVGQVIQLPDLAAIAPREPIDPSQVEPTTAAPAQTPTPSPGSTDAAAAPLPPTEPSASPAPALAPSIPAPATTRPGPTTTAPAKAEASPTPQTRSATPPPAGTVDTDDSSMFDGAQRTAWWSIPMGLLLASGLVVMLRRLRGRRVHELHPGEQLAAPPPVAVGTELAASQAAPVARLNALRHLLRSITPHARELDDPPAVRAVELSDDRVEVMFAEPAPFPPAGWSTADGGRSWQHPIDEPSAAEPAIRQLVTPALVTVGRRAGGGEVMLDVETAGSVSLRGDRNACLGLARSMVLELATYPLGVPMDVGLVGLDVDGVEHCDRAWANTTMTRAVRVARELLIAETGARSMLAARAALDDDDGCLDPNVFVVDRGALNEPDSALLDELVELCQPQSGVAVIVIGAHDHARELIDLDAAGGATWSGATLVAPLLSREAVAQVAVMFDHAVHAQVEPLEPSPVVTDLITAAADTVGRAPIEPDRTAEAAEENAASDVEEPDELAYVPPSPDVLVRVMGEVDVDGRELLAASDVELLTLLVCLRDRCPNIDTITTLLERGQTAAVQTRVSRLRAKLGVGVDGEPLLPMARSGRGSRGRYALSALVMTDVEMLEHRYRSSLRLPSQEALQVLRDGLTLMGGPAFRARTGYSWAGPEGVTSRVANIVTTYAARLMELAFEANELDLVLETARCAGRVIDDPVAEVPMRRLQREYADASGDPRLRAAVDEALRRLSDYADETDRLIPDDL